mgnify:FL=1
MELTMVVRCWDCKRRTAFHWNGHSVDLPKSCPRCGSLNGSAYSSIKAGAKAQAQTGG